jgi:hypothetical protein
VCKYTSFVLNGMELSTEASRSVASEPRRRAAVSLCVAITTPAKSSEPPGNCTFACGGPVGTRAVHEAPRSLGGSAMCRMQFFTESAAHAQVKQQACGPDLKP